ncbi:MAG: DeoR/GlpR family DNA-binding transcription regulator [Anaerolineales bacterium]|jgi:DeoR/GlpR family transcriptional regulator of sugar metabolism
MLKEERHQKIVDLVKDKGAVAVDELCEKFGISQSTVSRDLQILNQAGKLVKTHGGAVAISNGLAVEPSVSYRKTQFTKEKQRIAIKAAEYLKSDETIILDSGTTTFWIVEHLQHLSQLNVWTNDLYIAFELIGHENVEVTMLGGNLRKKYFNTMGVLTNQLLGSIHVDRLFIGVDAINCEGGLMVYSPEEAELKRLMIKTAKETIVVCDHSKFEKMALMSICPIEEIHRVITGKETDPEAINEIRKINIEVDLV